MDIHARHRRVSLPGRTPWLLPRLPHRLLGGGEHGRHPPALVLGAASVSWTFASLAAGRPIIRTSYRLAASVGGVCLVAGCLVLITLDPAGGLFRPATGSLLIGVGMGFCNTSFLVSTQAGVGWGERGMATSSIMFMRMAGSSAGAAMFGAILNFGIDRRMPDAGDAVNRLLEPTARQTLGTDRIARLIEAIAGSVHIVYIVAGIVAVLSLLLALALPKRLSPTRPLTRP